MNKDDLLHVVDSIKEAITPIHKEGYKIIAIAFVSAFILSMISSLLGHIAFIFALFCLYFFRDPARVTPKEEGLIISPADGKVSCIVKDADIPQGLDLDPKKKWTRVSTFLSVLNVHIQRIPISGKITKLHYNKGLFLNANLDKASEDNERQSCVVETKNGTEIGFVQIAGLIARRIVCDLKKGQNVKAGEQYGIIRFGSRVDVYLPEGVEPKVEVGQIMVGGETVIADTKQVKKVSSVKHEVKKTTSVKVVKKASKPKISKPTKAKAAKSTSSKTKSK